MLWPWFCRGGVGEMASQRFGQGCAETLAEPGSNVSFPQSLCRAYIAEHPWFSLKLSLLKLLHLSIACWVITSFRPLPSLALSHHLPGLRAAIPVFARNSIILETAQTVFQKTALFSCTTCKGWKCRELTGCFVSGGVFSPFCRCHSGAPPDFYLSTIPWQSHGLRAEPQLHWLKAVRAHSSQTPQELAPIFFFNFMFLSVWEVTSGT